MNLNTKENVYYLDNKTIVRDNITFTSLSLSYGYYNNYHENYEVFKSYFGYYNISVLKKYCKCAEKKSSFKNFIYHNITSPLNIYVAGVKV